MMLPIPISQLAHMLKSFATRIDQPELLDLGHGSASDVADNLSEMWRINRMLGGMRALTQHLYPRLAMIDNSIMLADLGAGAADVAASIGAWAHKHDVPLRIVCVDCSERSLAVARTKLNHRVQIELLRADAQRLPFPPDSVDIVISTLFLHHFAPEQATQILCDAFASARRAIIISDLVRGWLPYLAFKLVQPVFARNYLTRIDGALSIRRAYTPVELREMAAAAGLPNARVYTHWPWRMTLVADKGIL